jgi:mono/diheme cytochrome c family protein
VRFWTLVKPILIAGLIGLALGPVAVFIFVKSGVYDVGAAKRHTKLTEWITHDTMTHSVSRHAKGISPPAWTSAGHLVAGFCAYETHCVACHGAAGIAREQWVSGMEPQPPYLLDAPRKFTPPQLFWIVKHGIKMTGMPAWGNSLSDAQAWGVVAWLEASTKLPPQTYVRWRSERRCGPSIGLPAPAR